MNKKEWFETWFDSKYYHLLYDHRDHKEAQQFIVKLIEKLKPTNSSKILDMGCGKGRHAIQLSTMGYEVTGLDISEESILHARQYEKENLTFFAHDMRKLFRYNYYDYTLSLFTSFGFFKTMREHQQVIRHYYNGLRKDGILVIDFMNVIKVQRNLVKVEKIRKGAITFHIKRSIIDNYITKNIKFTAENTSCDFTERVYGFTQEDITTLLKSEGFNILHVYGDYSLSPFDKNSAERLLIIAKKQNI